MDLYEFKANRVPGQLGLHNENMIFLGEMSQTEQQNRTF